MKDAHDAREFRQWVSMDAQGNVLAVHEFAASDEQPLPEIVDVTPLGRRDWAKVDDATMQPIRLEHAILVAESEAEKLKTKAPKVTIATVEKTTM